MTEDKGQESGDREEKIRKIEAKSLAAERDILVLAKAKAQKSVNGDPSAPNLAALEKATRMLADHNARLNPSAPSFENRIEALNWLKRQGYKIGKSKLYQDCKKGLLKLQDSGAILESDLKKYIRKADLQQLSAAPDADPNDTLTQKNEEELKKLKIQTENLRLELDIKKKLYISRPDFEMEFAGKVAILKAGLEFMIYSNALELVELVLDGDPEDAPQRLIERQTRALESQFNDFANIKKFQVVFGEEEEIEESGE